MKTKKKDIISLLFILSILVAYAFINAGIVVYTQVNSAYTDTVEYSDGYEKTIENENNSDNEQSMGEQPVEILNEEIGQDTVAVQKNLPYDVKDLVESLGQYKYYENPYYNRGLQSYVNSFNEYYSGYGSQQRAEITSIESILDESGITKEFVKKLLDKDGVNIIEDVDFVRVDVLEDDSLKATVFESDLQRKYFMRSAKSKQNPDEETYYYFGGLLDDKPSGEGALFKISQYGLHLNFVGNFSNGRKNGKGVTFGDDIYGNVVRGINQYKNNEFQNSGVIYYGDEFEEMFLGLILNLNSYLSSSEFNNYDSNRQIEIYNNIIKNKFAGELLCFTYSSLALEKDNVIKVKYPVIRPVKAYEGGFNNDLYSGDGIKYGRTGLVWYSGNFKNDIYDGKGILYYAGTCLKEYEGDFKGGKFYGKGTQYNLDGSVQKSGKFNNVEIDKENKIAQQIHISYLCLSELGKNDMKLYYEN